MLVNREEGEDEVSCDECGKLRKVTYLIQGNKNQETGTGILLCNVCTNRLMTGKHLTFRIIDNAKTDK
jgi:hypothetical protein